jgi:hypothetical protein
VEDAAAQGDALMVFTALQALAIIFALFAWSRTLIRWKDHQINVSGFLLWSLVWMALGIAAVSPTTPRMLSKIVGVQRPVDVLIYGSIIILLYLMFRLYIKIEGNNFEITRIVRAMALSQPRKRK